MKYIFILLSIFLIGCQSEYHKAEYHKAYVYDITVRDKKGNIVEYIPNADINFASSNSIMYEIVYSSTGEYHTYILTIEPGESFDFSKKWR